MNGIAQGVLGCVCGWWWWWGGGGAAAGSRKKTEIVLRGQWLSNWRYYQQTAFQILVGFFNVVPVMVPEK